MIHRMTCVAAVALACAGAGVLGTACSSSSSSGSSSGNTFSATASAVTGAADSHCHEVVEVSPAACHGGGGGEADAGGAGEADAGSAGEADGGGGGDFGATMFNAEGDDDDCKYHVSWSAASGTGGVTFTVKVTTKKDNAPVAGAPVEIEAFLDDAHPAANTNLSTKETSPGTYTVGPVGFDMSGRWTVRFHIHDDCDDSERSPHGHAAFFVQVDTK